LCLRCFVVEGLDNIEVYLSNEFPTVGAVTIITDSYTVCGQYRGPVNASQKITVVCATQDHKSRYVVVRSADGTPERLCIAEVAVYATESMQLLIYTVSQKNDTDVAQYNFDANQ